LTAQVDSRNDRRASGPSTRLEIRGRSSA